MKKRTRNQKGFAPLLIVALVAVIVIVVVFFVTQKGATTQQTAQNIPAIKNSSDLNTVSSDLDSTDINQLDKEMGQLETDTSGF